MKRGSAIRCLALAAAIGGLGAIAWLMLPQPAPPSPTAPVSDAAAIPSGEPQAPSAVPPPPVDRAEPGAVRAVSESGPQLRIVDRDGRALGGAQVFALPAGDAATLIGSTAVEESGSRFEADATGTVRLPQVDGDLVVAARRGALFGRATIHRGEQDRELCVSEEHSLRVLVRFADGRIAPGIPFTIELTSRDSGTSRFRTDARGECTIPHWDEFGSAAIAKLGGPDPRLQLRFVVPLARRDATRPIASSAKAAEVSLPPGCPAIVHVDRPDGAAFDDRVSIWLDLASPRTLMAEPIETIVGNGKAVEIPFLPAAERLQIAAAPLDRAFEAVVEVVGPIGGVSRFEHHLRFAAAPIRPAVTVRPGEPRLRMRLRDSRGAILAQRRIVFESWVYGDARLFFRFEGATDDDGSLVWNFSSPPGPTKKITVKLRVFAANAELGLVEAVEIDVSGLLLPQDTDLGEVTTQAIPVIASGRVVDARGEPVAGAWVRSTRSGDRPDAPANSDVGTHTDAGGAFALRDEQGAGARLEVFHPHGVNIYPQPRAPRERTLFVSRTPMGRFAAMPFTVGDADLVCTLGANAIIRGRLASARSFAGLEVMARMGREVFFGKPDDHGRFAIEVARSGKATVIVRAAGKTQELARVEGVDVSGTKDADDPRLDGIDLVESRER